MNVKRAVVLMIAIALVAAMAPAAFAEHCLRCKIYMGRWSECIPATGFWEGRTICYDSATEPVCWFDGEICAAHGALPPLESEFTVASVERLDAPEPNENETRVATR